MFGPSAPASAPALADAVGLLAGQLLGLIGGRPAGAAVLDDRDVGELRARRAVWRVMRAYEEVAEGRSLDSVIAEARQLAPTAEQVSKAFQLWADVIDSLMEDAERRYGERASGEFKKRRVKGALLLWFRRADVDLGPVPEPLQPIVFEQLVDWSIESVYAVVVPNDLWAAAQAAAASRPSPWRRLTTWFFERVLMGGVLVRLLTRAMWNGVLNRYPLPAELAPAVAAAADRTQYIDDVVLAQTKQLGGYLATHQRDVAAVWNLVAAAVQEAEGFLSADGPTKKGYARGVILEALSRAGLGGVSGGLAHGLVAWLVDFGIDASVALFNKHERFEHRAHRSSPQPLRAAPRPYGSALGPARRPVAPPVARPLRAPVAGPGFAPALGPLVDLHMQLGTLGSQIAMDHLLLAGDAFAASMEARTAQPPRHRQF